ncbi:arsenate reductase ArsC [Nitrospirillum sp. BR 11752]|uniref:Arsenate reductase n=1 Tax=Nitrospirillum amazonense TaxID=28077 RepID=A0A560HAN6_9PROT|nr:arsenate reductase ArsC [Nitrospirillum amazonense]MEE3624705.1 arsenate reductase ArsC [Nitrospirillum sp. BR 11752]TWB43397.1 arsenate reductase [Nitrospirillum amazonense]
MATVYRVLFLCQFNSARSIMAEALMRHWGGDRFVVFSAGSDPLPECNPIALDLLTKARISTDGLHPKSWNQFAGPDVAPMDFIFHTCDASAGATAPAWPGHPMIAHWGFPDPQGFKGSEVEQRALFNLLFGMIERRVRIFCSLPEQRLARLTAETLAAMHNSEEGWAAAG